MPMQLYEEKREKERERERKGEERVRENEDRIILVHFKGKKPCTEHTCTCIIKLIYL